MKTSKILVLSIILCVISIGAMAFTIYDQKQTQVPFTIAITKSHAALFENYKALSSKLSREIDLEIYDNESELLKAVYGGDVDAFSINVFAYIKQFADLPKGKAILGLPSDYYLIAKHNRALNRPKIGIFDDTLSYYLLQGGKYAPVHYSDTRERLQSLNDGLIDFAIVSSVDYNADTAVIVKKMSTLDYTEDLFILTNPWIESDMEIGFEIVPHLSSIMTDEIKAPDENMLMKAMSELFRDEKIHTRYYYKDLVYFAQP